MEGGGRVKGEGRGRKEGRKIEERERGRRTLKKLTQFEPASEIATCMRAMWRDTGQIKHSRSWLGPVCRGGKLLLVARKIAEEDEEPVADVGGHRHLVREEG